jgi:hypothetical protein
MTKVTQELALSVKLAYNERMRSRNIQPTALFSPSGKPDVIQLQTSRSQL